MLVNRSISEAELLQELSRLNNDPSVHGIIVQMPLDCDSPIDSHLITNTVAVDKDVDGLTTVSEGRLATGDITSGFIPCTPAGCLELIKRSGVKIEGANAVVIGKKFGFLCCLLSFSLAKGLGNSMKVIRNFFEC